MIQNTGASHLQAPWMVIVNLQADNGKMAKHWPEIRKKLAELLPQADFRISSQRGAATALVAEGIDSGIRHFLAVGGDGTAHQVVNGLMQQTSIPSAELVFALLPFGTGNDWIKTHGIPKQWSVWKAMFIAGKIQQQNVGHIQFAEGERYFINVAGFAYDAFVVRFLQGGKRWLSPKLFYFWATFRCLFSYQPQRGIIQYNDNKDQEAFYTINIGVCKYSGGGMQFVPHADPSSNQLALTYVGQLSKLRVALNSYRFYEGRIAQFKPAILAKTATVNIHPNEGQEILIEADGEFLGSCPAAVSFLSAALHFIGR